MPSVDTSEYKYKLGVKNHNFGDHFDDLQAVTCLTLFVICCFLSYLFTCVFDVKILNNNKMVLFVITVR